MTTINVTTYNDFDSALAAHEEITGTDFYQCFENSKKDPGNTGQYFVADNGDIYYVYECKGGYDNGLRLLHKLTIGASMNNARFNQVILHGPIYLEDGEVKTNVEQIEVIEQNWDRGAENRKVLAKHLMLVTTEA